MSFYRQKALTPDETDTNLSYSVEQFSSKITGTVTNTTEDKWASATVYYYSEVDGCYLLNSVKGSQTISFVKPNASADFVDNIAYGSNQDGHIYEAKPIAVTYKTDKN